MVSRRGLTGGDKQIPEELNDAGYVLIVPNYRLITPYVDGNAPLFHVRKDSAPYIIVTGDPEQELYGRYEENLYMWRMMKLAGHPDVRLYRLDGYDHGDMARPAFHILRNEITRLLSPEK